MKAGKIFFSKKSNGLNFSLFILLLLSAQLSFAQEAPLELGKVQPTWWSAMWQLEKVSDAPDYYRLKNRNTGTYLHNEGGPLAVGKMQPNWWSAMWQLEKVSDAPDYYRLKNRNTATYLHNEGGKLALGKVQSNWWSAMWQLEKVSDAPNFSRLKNRNTATYLHNEKQQATAPAADEQVVVNNGSDLGYNPPAKSFNFSVKNTSMWLVSFRTYTNASGWSSWKNVDLGYSGTIAQEGLVTNYEIQYKDVLTWKKIPAIPVMASEPKNQSFTVSGNTFTGINMK